MLPLAYFLRSEGTGRCRYAWQRPYIDSFWQNVARSINTILLRQFHAIPLQNGSNGIGSKLLSTIDYIAADPSTSLPAPAAQ